MEIRRKEKTKKKNYSKRNVGKGKERKKRGWKRRLRYSQQEKSFVYGNTQTIRSTYAQNRKGRKKLGQCIRVRVLDVASVGQSMEICLSTRTILILNWQLVPYTCEIWLKVENCILDGPLRRCESSLFHIACPETFAGTFQHRYTTQLPINFSSLPIHRPRGRQSGIIIKRKT